MEFKFDLQRFKGDTTVQSYTPTEYELELQQMQSELARHYAPNATWLNDVARQLLQDSVGTVQQDYNSLNQQAQQRINEAYNNLGYITKSNSAAANSANEGLGRLIGQYEGYRDWYDNEIYGGLVPEITQAQEKATNALERDMKTVDNALSTYQNNMKSTPYSAEDLAAQGITDYTKTGQGGLVDLLNAYRTQSANYANQANAAYTGDGSGGSSLQSRGFIGANDEAYQTVLKELGALQNGELPTNYLNNMTDAIRSAMNSTIGDTMNNLAQRGVLNSSVTNAAINDIEKNVSDTLAQQYLNNINTLGGLAQNKFQDAITSTSETAGLANQQYQNQLNDLNTRLGITDKITGTYGNLFEAANTGAQNNANLANQNFSNAMTGTTNLTNLYGQAQNNAYNALNSEAQLLNQQYNNTSNANSANANIYSNVGIGQANAPLVTASAAQEAAQTPATNLWNASIGLTGSNNSALAAASGKGTTTTSTGGGGLLSGLFGGLF